MNKISLDGQVFGRLTVIKCEGRKGKKRVWLCKCSCGNEIITLSDSLKSGKTKSCRCLKIEINSTKGTHRKRHTRLFSIWQGMKTRCGNPNAGNYKNYGGRGITITPEWIHDFIAFYNWAMSHGYEESLTIDRIDGDKGYCPENCQWASYKTQANNRRSNKHIKLNGKVKTIQEWAGQVRNVL